MSEATGMKRNKCKVIGITGGIGSGKSEIIRLICEEDKSIVLDSDSIAASLEQKGASCYEDIISSFGTDILLDSEEIDRKKLASLVFQDERLLKKLNAIVHPKVKEYIISAIDSIRQNEEYRYCLLESALFFEENYEQLCDDVWYIYVSVENRCQRLQKSRGYSLDKIREIMNNQMSEEQYRSHSHVVIDNNQGLVWAKKQIREELTCRNR